MSITVALPPGLETRLRAHADAAGKDVATVILEAVEARLALLQLNLREILAPAHADFQASSMNDAELETLLQEALDTVRSERRAFPDLPSA